MTTPSPVRFAVVSPGRWGRKLLDAARESPLLRFAGVHSRTPERAAEVASAYGGRTYASYAELLADATVEAVLLPTPHFLHHAQTLQALRAGKHVFVEKPIAGTLAEAEEMARAAEASGRAGAEEKFKLLEHAVLRQFPGPGPPRSARFSGLAAPGRRLEQLLLPGVALPGRRQR